MMAPGCLVHRGELACIHGGLVDRDLTGLRPEAGIDALGRNLANILLWVHYERHLLTLGMGGTRARVSWRDHAGGNEPLYCGAHSQARR